MTINIVVRARRGEHPERLIRRFTKKVKKKRILEAAKEHMRYEKPSVKRKRMRKRRKENSRRYQEKQQ